MKKTVQQKKFHRGAVGIMGALIVSLVGAQCTLAPSGGQQALQKASQPVTLHYWRVFDDEEALVPIIAAYQQIHPNVTIEYKKFRYEEYERALLEAFAEDRGPDIFSLPNNDINHHFAKLLPLPAAMVTSTLAEEGMLQKKKVPKLVVTRGMCVKISLTPLPTMPFGATRMARNRSWACPWRSIRSRFFTTKTS